MAGANSFFRHQDPITFLLTGLAIIVISVFDVCIYLLQAHSMFIKSALVTVSFSAIRFVIAFIFLVAHLKLSVNIAIAISALSSIVGIFLTRLWLSLSLFPIPGFPYFSKLITFSGWLGVYRICTTVISRFDIQFVMLFFGPQTTGMYSVAARLANFYPMIIFSLSSIVATKLANPSTKISLVLTLKNIFMGLVCLCAGMILVALMSRQIVGTLFGPTAVESALAYSLLTIAYIPQIILVIPISIITYVFRNPKLVGLLSLLQLAGTIALAFMLTNQFNTYAPAIALLISSSVLLLFTSISIFKKWPTFSLEF
jgi:O-antigen/teichoic acid export membrane protein